VSVRIDDALPPANTVTGLGRLTAIPSGAMPVQAADKLTVEPNPFTEENTMVVDFDTSGVSVNTAGEGWVRKSGLGLETTVPAGVTVSHRAVLCDKPVGLVPITVNSYVPRGTESSTKMVTADALVPPTDVAIWLGPLSLNDAVTPDGPEYVNETV